MPALAPTDQILRRRIPKGSLRDLVENRVVFGAEGAELAVYDTVRPAQNVLLQAANPLYCAMVTGEKRVHTASGKTLPFLPSESLVVPAGQPIRIDFPGASDERPTKCLAIEIDRTKVARVVQTLNERAPRRVGYGEWVYEDDTVCHFQNSPGFERTIRQLTRLFVEDHPDKEMLIDLRVQELVVRMLRMEARRVLLATSEARAASDPMAAAVEYAREHLGEPLTVGDLAEVAHMSEPTFYRHFRDEFGQTPLAFLTELRIRRARHLLNNSRRTVSEVAAEVGFSSPSHFIRIFRRHVGMTPKQYQLQQRERTLGHRSAAVAAGA